MASPNEFKQTFPGQQEGEEVQLVFRQHPAVMRRALIYGMLAVLIVILPFYYWPTLDYWAHGLLLKVAGVFGIVILVLWGIRWVGWYYSIYIATDRRLIQIRQKGFFNRQFTEYRLDRIQNLHYHVKGLQGVMFKYGDITAQTITGELNMEMIHHPVHIHRELMEIVRRANS